MGKIRYIIASTLVILLFVVIHKQESEHLIIAPLNPGELQFTEFKDSIVFDGKIDEESWSKIPKHQLTYYSGNRKRKDDSTPPPLAHIQLANTAEYFVIGFNAPGRPNNKDIISAKDHEKDYANLWKEDTLEIFLGLEQDINKYFHFIVNPNGSLSDAYYTSSGRNAGWNSSFEAKTHKTGSSWSAEIKIPIVDLNFNPKTAWRIQVMHVRQQPRPQTIQLLENYQGSIHQPRLFSSIQVPQAIASRAFHINPFEQSNDGGLQVKFKSSIANKSNKDATFLIQCTSLNDDMHQQMINKEISVLKNNDSPLSLNLLCKDGINNSFEVKIINKTTGKLVSRQSFTVTPPSQALFNQMPKDTNELLKLVNLKFPIIDIHTHLNPDDFNKTTTNIIRDSGVEKLVSLNLNIQDTPENVKASIERYSKSYGNNVIPFFRLIGQYKWVDSKEETEQLLNNIRTAHKLGIKGWKIGKEIGLWARDTNNKLVQVDDPRLDPLFELMEELELPILIHSSDPDRFLLDLSIQAKQNPNTPSKQKILDDLFKRIKRHPKATFIAAHLVNLSHDPIRIAYLFDKYPNLYADLSGRIRQSQFRPKLSKWLYEHYSHRILFGTDGNASSVNFRSGRFYLYHRLILETDLPHIPAPRPGKGDLPTHIQGMSLSQQALENIYFKNARKILKMN